jgi:nitrite reductase (NADH) large subunit
MNIIIVGAGPAGVTVAETLRQESPLADITMLTGESHPPYAPPAMVDHFLTDSGRHNWRGFDWPDRTGVDYRPGTTVVSVDPARHSLKTASGEDLGYDKLVLAAGSRLYASPDRSDLDGIYNFKSLSAAQALVDRARSGEAKTALIVGAGFIGIEIAMLLVALGVQVTMVEMLDQVMPRALDARTADIVLSTIRKKGVDVRLETEATAFVGESQAEGVSLVSGETLAADLIVAATGLHPNIEFLSGSGIDVDWGVKVNDHLMTNATDVYAAGDLVEAPDRLTGVTYVHAIFPNAREQGRVVGLNLAGVDVSYEGADQMNSLKHLGLPIMVAGLKDGDEVLYRSTGWAHRTLYLKQNRLVGYQMVGDTTLAGVFRSLMNRQEDLTRFKDRLLDPTFGQGVLVWDAVGAPA